MFRTLRRKIFRLAFVSGAGAAATYFLDRERGQERREQAKSKADSLLKRGGDAGGGSWQPESVAKAYDSTATATVPPPASAPTITDVLATPDREIDPLAPPTGPVSTL